RGARHFRALARAPESLGPFVRGPGSKDRRTVGELSPNLFHGRADRLRHAAVEKLGGGVLARVVIASNRVTPPSARSGREGGLAVAVREALRRSGGLWFGWSGTVADATSSEPTVARSGKITYAT